MSAEEISSRIPEKISEKLYFWAPDASVEAVATTESCGILSPAAAMRMRVSSPDGVKEVPDVLSVTGASVASVVRAESSEPETGGVFSPQDVKEKQKSAQSIKQTNFFISTFPFWALPHKR